MSLRIAIACLLSLVLVPAALASGSYVRAASHRAGLDDYPRYELGKNVSHGRIALPERETGSLEALEEQAEILAELSDRLPRSARGRIDLPALAGRLTPDQLDAVRYYLKVRYRVR